MRKHKIYIVGIGPGDESMMTPEAIHALEESDTIVGYSVYLELLGERFKQKNWLSTPMKQEVKRCQMCFEEAKKGNIVSIICSGDAGVYGMASLMYEIGRKEQEVELVVIPGITAAHSGAAILGAPLNHDYCVISLSDLLTPWQQIEKRLIAAAIGDFAIAIYNPSSHKRSDYLRKACDILMANGVAPHRVCGYVENIGRENTKVETCSMMTLRDKQVNMFTTVFIGNSQTELIKGKMITKRGYRV